MSTSGVGRSESLGGPTPGQTPISLTSHARLGLRWSLSSLLIVALLQIVYTSFTSRRLAPHEFGFYATEQALASLIGYLSFTTLGSAVLRLPDDRAGRIVGRSLTLAAIA